MNQCLRVRTSTCADTAVRPQILVNERHAAPVGGEIAHNLAFRTEWFSALTWVRVAALKQTLAVFTRLGAFPYAAVVEDSA